LVSKAMEAAECKLYNRKRITEKPFDLGTKQKKEKRLPKNGDLRHAAM